MEILVCIKQVPGTADVEVDSVTGVLKRDGVESKLNPYDLFALEMGFELAEKENARVTVITMGPMQAMEVLKEAVYMGAESGVLVSDRCFAGADVCATSYTLCQGIQKAGTFVSFFAENRPRMGIQPRWDRKSLNLWGFPMVQM